MYFEGNKPEENSKLNGKQKESQKGIKEIIQSKREEVEYLKKESK